MSDTVIQVDHLSKQYRLGAINAKRFRDDVSRWMARLRGKPDPLSKIGQEIRAASGNGRANGLTSDVFWALKDVSFEVKRGEVLGVIGRNGAGKSTLFKILSQVTSPTRGEVRIKGRVASLLEVGTGFHPELSGRDNIFLNGAILGMTKAEIKRKFDEIVAFSEVEKFLDTPVKRYSSGMYVRLAFAVAAHLEPEILIVDEVLAVGDAEFQKKCLGKMGDVSSQGRTVLFVSHNMVAVQTLCRRAILLREGQLAGAGDPASVISEYLQAFLAKDLVAEWPSPEAAPGNDIVRVRRVKVLPEGSAANGMISMQTPIRIETEFWSLLPGRTVHLGYHLINDQGIVVLTTGCEPDTYSVGTYKARFQIPGRFLNSGGYRLKLLIVENEGRVTYENANLASFNVVDVAARNRAHLGREPGVVQFAIPWTVLSESNELT